MTITTTAKKTTIPVPGPLRRVRPDTAAFRTELCLALGWLPDPARLRDLADATGATVDRVRYHVAQMAANGLITTSKDQHGRVVVSLPVTLPAEVQTTAHGIVRRLRDDGEVRPACAILAARAARASRRELGATPPAVCPPQLRGLGVIVVGGFRCYVEPPVDAVA